LFTTHTVSSVWSSGLLQCSACVHTASGLGDEKALRALLVATKNSNDMPSSGDDYDYYSSFESFRRLMDIEGNRLLDMIQNMMRYHGAKGNLTNASKATEIEEKFDILVDANDQLLEKVGTALDEAAGLKKQDAPLVIATLSSPKQISGSWNKQIKASSTGKNSKFRLLAARNIQRPQLKFKDKIDNSLKAFVPKLTYKPNALVPLHESLQVERKTEKDDADDENLILPHPYKYELDHLNYPQCQTERSNPIVCLKCQFQIYYTASYFNRLS